MQQYQTKQKYPGEHQGYPGERQGYPRDQSFQSFPGDARSDAQPFVRGKPIPQLYKPPYFMANAASFIMALAGMIFFFIAFGGPAWYIVPPEHTVIPKTFGLWRLCVRSECILDMTNDYMVKRYLAFEGAGQMTVNPEVIYAYENFLVPIKVLMCIAVIFVFIYMGANMVFIMGYPTFFLEAIAQMFTGVLVGIAVGMFGGQFRDRLHDAPFGWSYWCGVVATMILLANGAAMMVISIFVYRKRGGFYRKK